jgi:hypothetical protein
MTIAVMFLFIFAMGASIAGEVNATSACAAINPDGTVKAGRNESFRVNRAAAETRRLSLGNYEVDFTPLGTNITGFARSAVLDTQAVGSTKGEITVADRFGDASSVFVVTTDSAGNNADRGFDLCLH